MSRNLNIDLMEEGEKRHNETKKPRSANFSPSSVYRGLVVDNADPLRSGRIRVFVAGIVPEGSNLWAVPRTGNNFAGAGSFIVPPVGSTVWIEFEGGDPSKLLYSTGGFDTTSSYGLEGQVSQSTDKAPFELPSEVFQLSGGQAGYSSEYLAPPDAFLDNGKEDLISYVDVVHRSLKGATLKIDERDERESISILDRSGNIIKLVSPVSADENMMNNAYRRAGVDASRDLKREELEKLKISKLLRAKEGKELDDFILLKMLQGSIIRVVEGAKRHLINISSKFIKPATNEEIGYSEDLTPEVDGDREVDITMESYPTQKVRMKVGGTTIIIEAGKVTINNSVVVEPEKVSIGNALVVEGGKVSVLGDLHISGSAYAEDFKTSSLSLNDHKHAGVVIGDAKTQPGEGGGGASSVGELGEKGLDIDYTDEYDSKLMNRKLKSFSYQVSGSDDSDIEKMLDAGVFPDNAEHLNPNNQDYTEENAY